MSSIVTIGREVFHANVHIASGIPNPLTRPPSTSPPCGRSIARPRQSIQIDCTEFLERGRGIRSHPALPITARIPYFDYISLIGLFADARRRAGGLHRPLALASASTGPQW